MKKGISTKDADVKGFLHMYKAGRHRSHVHLSDTEIAQCADALSTGTPCSELLKRYSECAECTGRVVALTHASKAARAKRNNAPGRDAFERARSVVGIRNARRRRMRWMMSAAAFIIVAGTGFLFIHTRAGKSDPLAVTVAKDPAVISAMAREVETRETPKHSAVVKGNRAANAGYSFFIMKNGGNTPGKVEDRVIQGFAESGKDMSAIIRNHAYDEITSGVDTLPKDARNDFRDGYLRGLITYALKSDTFSGNNRETILKLMRESNTPGIRALGKKLEDGEPGAEEELRAFAEKGE